MKIYSYSNTPDANPFPVTMTTMPTTPEWAGLVQVIVVRLVKVMAQLEPPSYVHQEREGERGREGEREGERERERGSAYVMPRLSLTRCMLIFGMSNGVLFF